MADKHAEACRKRPGLRAQVSRVSRLAASPRLARSAASDLCSFNVCPGLKRDVTSSPHHLAADRPLVLLPRQIHRVPFRYWVSVERCARILFARLINFPKSGADLIRFDTTRIASAMIYGVVGVPLRTYRDRTRLQYVRRDLIRRGGGAILV